MASRLTKGQKLLHTSLIKDNIYYKQDNTLTSPSPTSLVVRSSLHLLRLILILFSFIFSILFSFLIAFLLLSFLSIILVYVFLIFGILDVPFNAFLLFGFLSIILFFNFLYSVYLPQRILLDFP